MRLVRIGAVGSEQPAVLDADGNPRDVSQVVGDFNAEFFASGGMQRLQVDVGSGLAWPSLSNTTPKGRRDSTLKIQRVVCIPSGVSRSFGVVH